MNLEDRLRSHMHSGEDLFVDDASSADDISAAGHRRTRRNQVGVAVAGGVFAIGVVFGASSLIGNSDETNFALPEPEVGALESADAAMADDSFENPEGTQVFDGPVPAFEMIIGVGEGFVGLRNTNGVITAIQSTDGLAWDEVSTTGIPEGVEIGTLTHGDDTFGGIFRIFDNSIGAATNFIGTSSDLAVWTLVPVLETESDVFVSGLTISDGTVVSTAMVFSVRGEEEEAVTDQSGFAIVGPIGGPYAEVPVDAVENGVDRIVSTDAGYALSAFGNGTPQVLRSADGQTWDFATPADTNNQFATIEALDGSLLSIGTTDTGGAGVFQIFRSDDVGSSWSTVGVPTNLVSAPWWSFEVKSSGDVVAVLLVGESDEEVDGLFISRHALTVSTEDDFREIELAPYADVTATIILAGVSSDEVLLQVFDAPDAFDESLASSSGLAEEGVTDDLPIDEPETSNPAPRYVRVPLTAG